MTTTSQVLSAISPYLTTENIVNTTPLYNSQTGTGQVWVYQIPGTNPPVLVFQASGAIDCDGNQTSNCCCSTCAVPCTPKSSCNSCTDPEMQTTTSFQTSTGSQLTADQIPWYVLPLDPLNNGQKNPYFAYRSHGIDGGQSGLVIYGSNMEFGIFGDENGDPQSTGEVSWAMAKSLGIDPNPSTGGVESGVTYIVFTGVSNIVTPIESITEAQSKGQSALDTMMSQISGPPPGRAGWNCSGSPSYTCYSVSSGGQYTTQSDCIAACKSVVGGGGGCSPSCTPTQLCLLGTCVEKNYAYAAGVVLLLLLLKR